MTGLDLALIVTAFLAILTIGGAFVDRTIPGYEDDPMCRCGVRGGAQRHRHGGWVDRER